MRGGIAGIAAALRKTCEGQKHVTFTSACPRGYGALWFGIWINSRRQERMIKYTLPCLSLHGLIDVLAWKLSTYANLVKVKKDPFFNAFSSRALFKITKEYFSGPYVYYLHSYSLKTVAKFPGSALFAFYCLWCCQSILSAVEADVSPIQRNELILCIFVLSFWAFHHIFEFLILCENLVRVLRTLYFVSFPVLYWF